MEHAAYFIFLSDIYELDYPWIVVPGLPFLGLYFTESPDEIRSCYSLGCIQRVCLPPKPLFSKILLNLFAPDSWIEEGDDSFGVFLRGRDDFSKSAVADKG